MAVVCAQCGAKLGKPRRSVKLKEDKGPDSTTTHYEDHYQCSKCGCKPTKLRTEVKAKKPPKYAVKMTDKRPKALLRELRRKQRGTGQGGGSWGK